MEIALCLVFKEKGATRGKDTLLEQIYGAMAV